MTDWWALWRAHFRGTSISLVPVVPTVLDNRNRRLNKQSEQKPVSEPPLLWRWFRAPLLPPR